ncbi:MAG: ABC transporter permease, partial [Dysosmobacter sp.]|nr:ABC transporter permease [Dysosmobacter sp.]
MKYIFKRVLAGLATMLAVSFLTFAAFSLISGDTATAMLGTSATPERLAALRAELGLDRPLPARYGEWLAGFFTGDLGVSASYKQPVRDLLAPKVRLTLWLSLASFFLITAVSIPLGIFSAGRRRFEGVRT